MNQKYLPSRGFLARLLIIIIIVEFIFSIGQVIKFFKNRATRRNATVSLTVGNVIQKDSNDNGIADWEEYLWGLDPKKDGTKNREYIENKRKILLRDEISLTDEGILSENELLSREFFAAIIALQENDALDEETVQSLTNIIGKKIEASPIGDMYNKEMLQIGVSSQTMMTNYWESFKELATTYENENIGDELSFIAQGIQNNDSQAMYVAQMVASSYRSFGSNLMKIATPDLLADIHLSLANNYEKTAQSIEGLTQILVDPIIGMRSLINYKQYNDALVSDLENLSEFLQ